VEGLKNHLGIALEAQGVEWGGGGEEGLGFQGIRNPLIYPVTRGSDMSGMESRICPGL
jgi:hypothetical protein